MKITAGKPNKVNVKPFISTKKFSIVAEANDKNLITGFKVTIFAEDNRVVYFPVTGRLSSHYLKAWESVYNSIKKHL